MPGLLGAISLRTTSIWRPPNPVLQVIALEGWPPNLILGLREGEVPGGKYQGSLHRFKGQEVTSYNYAGRSHRVGCHLCPSPRSSPTLHDHHPPPQQLVLLLHFQQLVSASSSEVFSVRSSDILILKMSLHPSVTLSLAFAQPGSAGKAPSDNLVARWHYFDCQPE